MRNYSNRWKCKINKSKILVLNRQTQSKLALDLRQRRDLANKFHSVPGDRFTQGGAVITAQKTVSERNLESNCPSEQNVLKLIQ